MKSAGVLCMCALAIGLLASAEPPPQRVPTVTRLVQLFSGLENDWMEAVRRRDEAAVTRILGDSFEMRSALAPSGPVPAGDWVRNAVHEFHLRSFRISEMAVRELGTVAVVSFRLAQEGELGGKEESAECFVADVWMRQDGAWKVAARYAAAPDRHRPLGMPATDLTIPKKY
jgi:ketosteroid isomerase-like protein